MKLTNILGDLLLAIFLILFGLNYFVGIPFSDMIMAILALVAGLLKLFGK